ncbi:MAG: PAS domain S-box protein, partial [Bacillota bacterium]
MPNCSTVTEKNATAKDGFISFDKDWQLLFESVTQAIWETDASGSNVSDSPGWRNYTGQTYEEIQGLGFLNAVHPDDREYVEKLWLECVKKQNHFNAEIRVKGPNGAWKWINVLGAPVYDSNGNVTRWVGIDIDITERKEAIEDHVFHSRLLSNIQEAVLAFDEKGSIVFCNKEFERLFGVAKHEMLKLSKSELI